MKGLFPLFAGLFGMFAFSWFGLTAIPNWQIGHLDPQSDEEGTDIYPQPKSGMVERGRRVYNANGCVYCHSRWIRPDYAGADIERNWGARRSAPRDYIFDRPVLLGKMRTGQDLSNEGQPKPLAGQEGAVPAGSPASSPAASPAASPGAAATAPAGATATAGTSPAAPVAASASPAAAASSTPAAPAGSSSPAAQPPAANASLGAQQPSAESPIRSAAWHHRHLYSPASVVDDSIMPAYRFLYKKELIGGERSADALELTGKDAPPQGWEIVPTYDAQCLVAYLMAQDQSHPLKEAKSAFASAKPAAPVAASPSPAASPAPPK